MLHFISRLLVFWLSIATWCCLLSSSVTSGSTSNPSRLKIGALVAFNSTIGKVALQALQLAVQNVNEAEDLLKGTLLELEIMDSGCNPLQGAASAVELIKKEVVAIVGPQSTSVSHFVAHIGSATQVPILSFGATDPSLSQKQYSYFLRLAPSDALQMDAVAGLIESFRWREVALIYTDDDYGANGASALSFSLQKRGSRIVERASLVPGIDATGIRAELTRLQNSQSRVYVLHTQQQLGFRILYEAYYLTMIETGYVWIVTDLVANGLVKPNLDLPLIVQSLQGLLGTRRYISSSPQLQSLLTQWQKKYPADMQSLNTSYLNAYGLYAYDAVYTIAHAISLHLAQGQNLTFTEAPKFPADSGGASDLEHMKILQSGSLLRDKVLETVFSGTSGLIQFDEAGDIKDAVFEYINMVGKNPLVVAYWANRTSLSTSPPQHLNNLTTAANSTDSNSTKLAIVWPGGTTNTPRGWVPPRNGEPLKIGVPEKAGYTELVSITTDINNVTKYDGFCIKVFEAAVSHLTYAVPFQYYKISSSITGKTNPSYDDLIRKMVDEELDAAVGDITITADRLKLVDFTQPFIESGLVVLVARKDKQGSNRWAFLRPFTAPMWGTIFGFTLFMSFVIWILEHQENAEFGGAPREQLIIVLSFVFATLFSAHREGAQTFLGRIVLPLWLFVVLILNSSYTASLTAILTVDQLTPDIQGLDSLLRTDLPIGYQTGSFVRTYLIALNVRPERLKDFDSRDEYKRALDMGPNGGGVAAIVDELPYVEIFLASNCENYGIAGQEFTKSGWGFAFPRESEITADLSEEILRMSQTGELAQLRDYWFKGKKCSEEGTNVEVQSNQLGIKSFWVLFLIMGIVSIVCAVIYVGKESIVLCVHHAYIGQCWEQFKKFTKFGGRRT